MKLTAGSKAAFGIGAVGKDMVYALSSSYVMYYYQSVIGLSASFVGLILMIARVFDAANDPIMGVIAARTNTKWGRFRPWIMTGTVLNAFVLYALFSAPDLSGAGMMVFFSVVYILWGMTYTMMDIPYWSVIPAVAETPLERENLSVIGRTCAGVGSALIALGALISVSLLGGGSERLGFRYVALIVSAVFVATEIVCCIGIRERRVDAPKTASIGEMFHALFHNDQAIVVVVCLLLINTALYITSNLVIYFFKYDLGGAAWVTNYTLFNSVGGAFQILGMMILYPLLRRKLHNEQIFRTAIAMALLGYAVILLFCFTGLAGSVILLCVPGAIVFAGNGMLSVLTTLFLSNSVDYGQLKSGRREESVIFSLQTFVYKLASGVAVFLAGIGLDIIGLVGNSDETGAIAEQSAGTIIGLRLIMTVVPIVILIAAYIFFVRRFRLVDAEAERIAAQIRANNASGWK